MSAVVFAWMYSAYFAPQEATSTPTELIPTVTPVSGETILLPTPSPTPPPPTPTATPTQVVVAPTVAVADVTQEATADTGDAVTPAVNDAGVIEEATATPEPTRETSGALTFNFEASDYLDSLEVVADGAVVYSGPLEAGSATGYLSADHFQVYVSDPSVLVVVRENGDTFQMGDSYFELP